MPGLSSRPRVVLAGVHRKRAGASRDDRGNGQRRILEPFAKRADRVPASVHGALPFAEIGLMILPVVEMQPGRCQMARTVNLRVQLARLGSGREPCALQPESMSTNTWMCSPACAMASFSASTGLGVVGGDGEPHLGKSLSITNGTADVRSHHVVGEEHVAGAAQRKHFGFGEGRALVLDDSHGDLQPRDVDHLVCLAVGSKAPDVAGDRDHARDVLAEDFFEHDEPWRQDLVRIGNRVARMHGDSSLRRRSGITHSCSVKAEWIPAQILSQLVNRSRMRDHGGLVSARIIRSEWWHATYLAAPMQSSPGLSETQMSVACTHLGW